MSRAMFGTSNHRLKTGRGKNVDQTQTCPLEGAPVSETAGHLARDCAVRLDFVPNSRTDRLLT